jgi:hypothetical protein
MFPKGVDIGKVGTVIENKETSCHFTDSLTVHHMQKLLSHTEFSLLKGSVTIPK